MMYALYRGFFRSAGPLADFWLRRREVAGKEDPARRDERRGKGARPRPGGKLLWCHAASVGESLSLLPLIERILNDYAEMSVLVTTGTVTSAKLMEQRLPVRAFHQYVPVDHPVWVNTFLDHWKPDMALWAESEFWPNLLLETAARNIPVVLVNARLSEKSFTRWQKAPGFAKSLLGVFTCCLAQNEKVSYYLKTLGAKNVTISGNLKYAAAALPVDENHLKEFQQSVSGRPVWLASSTHPGEDEQIIAAHKEIATAVPGLLTVIVPRHPARGEAVQHLCLEAGVPAVLRSRDVLPDERTGVYVADTMGELGLFYRAIPVSFIGGSLVPHGGHNPIEPAKLKSAVLYGPHVFNFTTISQDFEDRDAAWPVTDAKSLAAAVQALLSDLARKEGLIERAFSLVEEKAGVVDQIMENLGPVFAKAGMESRSSSTDNRRAS